MASVPAYRQALDSRSGGKIVRTRRAWSRRTPYERPRPSNLGRRENPSWISKFIFSPTLTVASGAGKLISSVFVSESSSSSSDSDSEDDVENEVGDSYQEEYDAGDGNHIFEETNGVKKNGVSEIFDLVRKNYTPEKKETKRLIEQLLMQETFSRAERDRLFQIIESRVVECETTGNEADRRLTEMSNRAVDTENGGSAVCNTAIVEAKKWLNEKRMGASSKIEIDHGPCTFNSVPMVTDEEIGSPVDLAKSYMRARPPWASPSLKNFDFKSPSPLGQLFKDESLYSINTHSSSKMKRELPASESWNIQEELRRVRSKATEEMLRNRPSNKLDWSSVRADNLKSHKEDKMHNAAKSLDQPTNLSTDNIVAPNLSVSKVTRDLSETGTCMLNTISVLQLDKDLEINPSIDEIVANSSSDDRECSTVHEVGALPNGFSTPVSSLAQEHSIEQNRVHKKGEEKKSPEKEHEVTVEEPCQLLSEAFVAPNIDENGTDKVQIEEKTKNVVVEDNATSNVKEVEQLKPSSQSSVAGNANGGAPMRRGRRRN